LHVVTLEQHCGALCVVALASSLRASGPSALIDYVQTTLAEEVVGLAAFGGVEEDFCGDVALGASLQLGMIVSVCH